MIKEIIKDVDLFNDVDKYDAILVGTNINGNMTQGLQRQIMLNYPYVHEQNIATKYGDENKLGTILECKEKGKPTFILLYINKGNYRPDIKKEFISYESLEKCLKIINILYKGSNLASTIIGSSRFDGLGDKVKILEIIEKHSKNFDLTIYDYEQKSRAEWLKEIRQKELEIKQVDIEKYYETVKKRKEEANERFTKNGHARY